MAKTNRKKCPECKGKTQCDCHLCWGRGYLAPKGEGSRLQPAQPDDQYPGVPEQGWKPIGPDSADKIKQERSFFGEKIERMLRQAQKNPNQHGMCPFKPEEVANIRLLIGLLETDRYHLLKDAEKLEWEVDRLRKEASREQA